MEVFGHTATPPGSFTCLCADGFADGVCDYDYILPYTDQCTRQQGTCGINVDECASVPCGNAGICTANPLAISSYSCECEAGFDGDNCADDINECANVPCFNGAACEEGVDSYSCTCPAGWQGDNCEDDVDECSSDPCQGDASCTESNVDLAVPLDAYMCTCGAGFENGVSGFGGNCDVDIDECSSTPCQNDALCIDSSTDDSVLPDSYRCSCTAGFANGLCSYNYIAEYEEECSVSDTISSATLSGNCDIDVNECDSSPCLNDAACMDSTGDASLSYDVYQCACTDGYANGMCDYSFIDHYTTECTVLDSRQQAALGGNCDVDVDECASGPCENGARCTESTLDPTVSVSSYQCSCTAGFANGLCDYSVITQYETECSVTESTASVALSGNCDLDVNECDSSPCENDATCLESISDSSVSSDAYRCACK